MKLIKIEHFRCGDFEGYSYLFAPDNKTSEEVEEDLSWVYQQQTKAQVPGKEPPYLLERISDYDDSLTIKEVKEKLAQNNLDREEYRKKLDNARQSFNHWMMQKGYMPLSLNEDLECYSMDWGHNHGERFEYSLTKGLDFNPNKKDEDT